MAIKNIGIFIVRRSACKDHLKHFWSSYYLPNHRCCSVRFVCMSYIYWDWTYIKPYRLLTMLSLQCYLSSLSVRADILPEHMATSYSAVQMVILVKVMCIYSFLQKHGIGFLFSGQIVKRSDERTWHKQQAGEAVLNSFNTVHWILKIWTVDVVILI